MKIEEIVRMSEDAKQKRNELNKEILSLTASLSGLKETMASAKAEGNLSAYKDAQEQYEETLFRINAIRNGLARPQYDVPEIKKAWNNYATRHNKVFSEKMNGFRQKVRDLVKDYKELAMMQNDAQYKNRCCSDLLISTDVCQLDVTDSLPVDISGGHPGIAFFKLYGALSSVEAMNVQLIENGSVVGAISEDGTEGEASLHFLRNVNC